MTDIREGQRLLLTMPGTVLAVDREGFHFAADDEYEADGVQMFVGFEELEGGVIAQEIEEPRVQFGAGSLVRNKDYPEFVFVVTDEGYVFVPTGKYFPGTESHEFFTSEEYELIEVAA